MTLLVSAGLEFALERDGAPSVNGLLRGQANRLQLDIDDPSAFAGSGDAPAVRAFAEALAARGIVVKVVHDGRHLVSLGAVSAPWWQRRATGSRRIRIGSLRGAWTSARARARATTPTLPGVSALPPPTLFPLAPTFARRPRRSPTTTHDPARGGGARLVLSLERARIGDRQPIFWLEEQTTIGSDPTCDVVLTGLAAHHATVLHTAADEYVVRPVGGLVRVHGAPVFDSQLLRTGARVEIGPHAFGFYREEFADHGRPHGGRIGGEAGRQQPQPPRPTT